MSEPFIVRPGEGRLLDLGNFQAVVLADASATSGAFTVLQTQGEPPDFGPPIHVHRDAAEAFYVIEGTYLMFIEDRQELCPPGSFVYVPPNVQHTFTVVSREPGKKLNIFSPAAMVGFFEELAEAEANGIATPELLPTPPRDTAWESSGRCRRPTCEGVNPHRCHTGANGRIVDAASRRVSHPFHHLGPWDLRRTIATNRPRNIKGRGQRGPLHPSHPPPGAPRDCQPRD